MNTTQKSPKEDFHRFVMNIGQHPAEQVQYLQQIKDAMAAAVFMQIEVDGCDKDFRHFPAWQSIYLAADHQAQQIAGSTTFVGF